MKFKEIFVNESKTIELFRSDTVVHHSVHDVITHTPDHHFIQRDLGKVVGATAVIRLDYFVGSGNIKFIKNWKQK